MIQLRNFSNPEAKGGFTCYGKINTDTNGVGTITVKGKDYSAKITGISLTCLQSTASAVKGYNAYVVSLAYSSTTRLTTITIQANQIVDSGSGTTDISAYDGDVYYSFFVSDKTLPTDLSTNNTLIQEY